jgi:hypothetical protein
MTVQVRLRKLVDDIRRKPFPISDIIPLIQEAADELDILEATNRNLAHLVDKNIVIEVRNENDD